MTASLETEAIDRPLMRGIAMTGRKTLGDNERKAVKSLLGALDPFTDIRATMPLQYVRTFLLVALDEGKGVAEYAAKAGVSVSVMSRHLLDIGERNRHMEKGFGLITYRPNPTELRKHEVFLTDTGRALVHRIVRNWEK